MPVENEAFSPYLGRYRTFGLRVLRSGEEGVEEVMVLPGVSTDFGFTLRLAGLFTEKQLDPLRLLDVIGDLL
ncbi:DUF6514 family protein [Oscillibacter sp.]|uniref:DUF6514 family protein n=1 Tax=Oscillibacter sp. TaxID=1945593 RepID=UPI002D80EE8F|nr:hypothetical protein [Oscillibacter sp.]